MQYAFHVLYAAAMLVLGVILVLFVIRVRRLERRLDSLQSVLHKAISFDRFLRKLSKASRRVRRRYIVFRMASEGSVGHQELEEAIASKFKEVLGEATYAVARPKLVFLDKGCGILRVTHLYKNHAVAVLGIIRSVGNHKVILVPIAVTGTIKSARRRCV